MFELLVTRDQVTTTRTASGPSNYSAEASTLGLRAGQWPAQIAVQIGGGYVEIFQMPRVEHDGAAVVYTGRDQKRITVWND